MTRKIRDTLRRMMMRWSWWMLVPVAGVAWAAVPLPVVPGADGVVIMQPAEVDSISVVFVGRTISNANKGTAVAVVRGVPKQTDASPSSIITAHGADNVTGNSAVSITINPDQGCGSPGCRAGNSYEIILQPTDANSNRPIANIWLTVQKKQLSGS